LDGFCLLTRFCGLGTQAAKQPVPPLLVPFGFTQSPTPVEMTGAWCRANRQFLSGRRFPFWPSEENPNGRFISCVSEIRLEKTTVKTWGILCFLDVHFPANQHGSCFERSTGWRSILCRRRNSLGTIAPAGGEKRRLTFICESWGTQWLRGTFVLRAAGERLI